LNNIVSVLTDGSIDPTDGYDSLEEIQDDLSTKKGCKALMDKTWELFSSAVEDHIGEDSDLIRVKIVTDNKGKWLQLPKEAPIVESMEEDQSLTITPYELKMRAKGLDAPKEQADVKGVAPKKSKKAGALTGL